MSPPSDPRLAAPSHGCAGKHISSFNLLVAGVKGPLYLRGERQMNPGLKQGSCFFFVCVCRSPPSTPQMLPLWFKGSLLCLLILSCEWERAIRLEKWGGGGKPLTVGKGPSDQCVKREGSAGIRNVSFMGSTRYLIASLDCCKAVTCTAP